MWSVHFDAPSRNYGSELVWSTQGALGAQGAQSAQICRVCIFESVWIHGGMDTFAQGANDAHISKMCTVKWYAFISELLFTCIEVQQVHWAHTVHSSTHGPHRVTSLIAMCNLLYTEWCFVEKCPQDHIMFWLPRCIGGRATCTRPRPWNRPCGIRPHRMFTGHIEARGPTFQVMGSCLLITRFFIFVPKCYPATPTGSARFVHACSTML